jgi:hypothetical protein|tara:strand:+ start:9121 stop:11007 length:1887 start_codon:yes stop_codon:yes gene_type:complete
MSYVNEKISKDIKYIGKDFPTLRKNLINFAKTYYPSTFNDFNESSPGMMFLETTAYVGDVLSFYLDKQFKESLLPYATERKNINLLSQALGYIPKQAVASLVDVDIYQTVPSIGSGNSNRPDFKYALAIKGGMRVKSGNGTAFRREAPIDFSISGSANPTEVSVFTTDETTGEPTFYLLRKRESFQSGNSNSQTFTVGAAQAYLQLPLNRTNIISIDKVTDSDGNEWSEVPFIAQDTVFKRINNNQYNDPEFTQYNAETPYLLKLKKTSKRFTVKIREDGKMVIEFGSGTSNRPDEEIVPNPLNAGSMLPTATPMSRAFIDPSNFMFTKAYGEAPSNTTLTVEYSTGNGVKDNVEVGSITDIDFIQYISNGAGVDKVLFNSTKNSVAATNPTPAQGGRGAETVEEIRNNALAFFNAQGRVVSKDDYMIRTLTMPSIYGTVAKVYATQDEKLNISEATSRIRNPFAVSLYTLSYNKDKQLTTTNAATKENIKEYLSPYRLLTDSITIKNAHIINIGIDFEVISLPGFNSNDVLLRCISKMKEIFNIDRWQINQPIILADMYTELARIKGVQSIMNTEIFNLHDKQAGYSGNIYDISHATRNEVIYPSLDPSIFEVKYPNSNIKGRIVNI